MAVFKDTNGSIRIGYFEKMTYHETKMDTIEDKLSSLRTERDRYIHGTHQHRDIEHRIEEWGAARDVELLKFQSYAAALTAVSTLLLTK